MNKKLVVMPLLPEGKRNAISSETLMCLLRFNSKRELQRQIAKERKQGALILSSSAGGYYTSINREEIQDYIRTLENRAKHTFGALHSARRFLAEFDENQSRMDL